MTKNLCNRISQPKFTPEQIADCRKCRDISAKKRWCCRFGCWVKESDGIIQPNRKIAKPFPRNKVRPVDADSLKINYDKIVKERKSLPAVTGGQFTIVNFEDYSTKRKQCYDCDEPSCSIWRGCCGYKSLIYKEVVCPKGK
ncbi:MAG: hypothetical protein WC441_04820 [Patescibacteria group bacterium]